MTQALLNKLDTVNYENIVSADKTAEADSVAQDFLSVLNKTTEKQNESDSGNYNIKNDNNCRLIETDNNDANTIADLKNNAGSILEDLSNTISTAIIEIGAETAIDLNLTEEAAKLTEEMISEDTNEVLSAEVQTNENENNTTVTNTTVTKEENSTMMKDTLYSETQEPQILTAIIQQTHLSNAKNALSENKTDDSTSITDTQKMNSNVDISAKSSKNDMFAQIGTTNEDDVIISKSKTDSSNIKDIIDNDIIEDLHIESVKTETENNNSSSDLMQKQSPEENAMKAIIQSSAKYEDISLKASAQIQNTNQPQEINSAKIIEQISKQLDKMYNNSKIDIILNPESLGKVALQIVNSKEGLSAQFTVATQDARALLMKGLDGLKEALLSQGISVDNVTVKMSDSADNEYNQDWTEDESQNKQYKEQDSRRQKQKENEKQFEQMMFEINENGKV